MSDVIKVQDQYYILATAARALGTSAVLKHGDTFAVFDSLGDIVGAGAGEQGLYHEGTRFVSLLRLRLGKDRPLLLSARTNDDNTLFGADLTNPDVTAADIVLLPHDVVHVFRSRFLWDGVAHERVRMVNYSTEPVKVPISYEFAADYSDIFEVRGTRRVRRGTMLPAARLESGVALGYRGLDGAVRRTRLEWDVAPSSRTESSVTWDLQLAPHETLTLSLAITCEIEDGAPARGSTNAAIADRYDESYERLCAWRAAAVSEYAVIDTSNEQFNAWVRQSLSDVQMMVTDTDEGPYPYAGVPWFNTAFGRDGIITALEMLWLNPAMGRGVLRYLAATQATALMPERDAEPGKILHETRGGEMAALGEVPFGRYYGSVDATPLFVMLAGAYYRRTADRALIDSIWPNIERALEWIDRYGDRDGDDFVEYARRTPAGLVQQGWKDSQDSVFHADGRIAEAPIALCEVQAYVFGARKAAAMLARVRGETSRANALEEQAERLRARFEDAFWCESLGTYALALDGRKQQCRVRTSNPGHCLFTGIADRGRARRIAESLVAEDLFSGWGVRTLAATEVRYNPMSYHNGSIWPHDNALIAAGFGEYAFTDLVQAVVSGLFEASLFVEHHRLPELFCGFRRRAGYGPTLYPVACSPQAWAAASVFLLLQASLGLTLDAVSRHISIGHARLPAPLDWLKVRNLPVGPAASIDLMFERHADDVAVMVLARRGDIEVAITK